MTETSNDIGEPQFDPASAAVRLDEVRLRLFRLAVDAEHRRRQEETREADRSQARLDELASRTRARARRETLDDTIAHTKQQRALAEARTRARTFLTCYAEASGLDPYVAAVQVTEVANAEEG